MSFNQSYRNNWREHIQISISQNKIRRTLNGKLVFEVKGYPELRTEVVTLGAIFDQIKVFVGAKLDSLESHEVDHWIENFKEATGIGVFKL